ncbi:MAG TPA: hypothetical protein VGM50_23055 [Gemmatimonadaceae bacterium]|jgi:hypothetical protein
MAAPNTSEPRKTGDTLILSGTLDESTPLDHGDWDGAVAKINIADADSLALVVDHGVVTLDLTPLDADPAGPVKYRHQGTMPDEGSYLYEIEVTFTDTTVLTWPDDGSKNKLVVKPALG